MPNLKKSLFAFCVGLGLAASFAGTTVAAPSCSTCAYWETQCDNGNTTYCDKLRYCGHC